MKSLFAVTSAMALLVSIPIAAQTARPPAQTTKPGSLALTVVTERGQPVAGAAVSVRGAVDRAGKTAADGTVTILSLPAGTYRCRISGEGLITLEKEITIRAGARLATEAALTVAPPPPPVAPPPPVESRPTSASPGGPIGAAAALSIPDLVEQLLREPQPIAERQIGCSVATASRLIVARETVLMHRHADADEMLYLVAGEATLTLSERDLTLTPGWVAMIPRGTSHSIARRGRNPIVVLSVISGVPCSGL